MITYCQCRLFQEREVVSISNLSEKLTYDWQPLWSHYSSSAYGRSIVTHLLITTKLYFKLWISVWLQSNAVPTELFRLTNLSLTLMQHWKIKHLPPLDCNTEEWQLHCQNLRDDVYITTLEGKVCSWDQIYVYWYFDKWVKNLKMILALI